MTDHFHYRGQELFVEDVPLSFVAKEFGTPVYVYSKRTIQENWYAFHDPLAEIPHQLCYAVKANSNIGILHVLAKLGSGFDVVSMGELERVLLTGVDPEKIVFSGVGKTAVEIERALEKGIHSFNVESSQELERIHSIAKLLNKRANIALRINPDVDAHTHPHISTGLKENKFGLSIEEAFFLYEQASTLPHLHMRGIACHIGSQITELAPFIEALEKVLLLIDRLNAIGIHIETLNMGGGLGVCYHQETPPSTRDYAEAIKERIAGRRLYLLLEPGRAIVANAGVLLTKIEYLKYAEHKNFAITDAGMNDFIRPSFYEAWHDITPVFLREAIEHSQVYDVVGPVCETADCFAKDRKLIVETGDILAIRGAGAYGFSMSSNYNSRPRPAEILVDGKNIYMIRQRERIAELFANERIPH